MTRWEYARLESSDRGIGVIFTHRPAWTGLAPEAFFETLRRLGDEGWELVSALPLAAAGTLAAPAAEAASDRPDHYRQRDAGDRAPLPATSQTVHLQLATDRWLVFKRPQPEPVQQQRGTEGADMVKGLVGKHLLKGRLPLP